MTSGRVRDNEGTEYQLLKRAETSSLVRDPTTGDTRYLPNDRLELLEELSTHERQALSVHEAVRTLVRVVPDDATLGLVIDIAENGPVATRELLAVSDRCESDLNGQLTLLTATGILEQTTVAGERGYAATTAGEYAVSVLCEDTKPEE